MPVHLYVRPNLAIFLTPLHVVNIICVQMGFPILKLVVLGLSGILRESNATLRGQLFATLVRLQQRQRQPQLQPQLQQQQQQLLQNTSELLQFYQTQSGNMNLE